MKDKPMIKNKELKAAVDDAQIDEGEDHAFIRFTSKGMALAYHEAAQELLELRENGGWQTIDSAPKDTILLLFDDGRHVIGSFNTLVGGWRTSTHPVEALDPEYWCIPPNPPIPTPPKGENDA